MSTFLTSQQYEAHRRSRIQLNSTPHPVQPRSFSSFSRSSQSSCIQGILQEFKEKENGKKEQIDGWGGLPPRILHRILEMVPRNFQRHALRCFRLINSHWREAIDVNVSVLRPQRGAHILLSEVIESALKRFTSAGAVDFSGCNYSMGIPSTINCVAVLPNMRSLAIEGPKVDDNFIKTISMMTNLTELSITKSRITDWCLLYLRDLMVLRSLDLSYNSQISDAGIGHLKRFQGLKRLELKTCKKITDQGLRHLQGFRNLEHLSLDRVWRITYKGMSFLRRLTLLTCLQISDETSRGIWGVTDMSVDFMLPLVHLQRLSLPPSISGDGVRFLGRLSLLTCLKWCLDESMDAELESLCALRSLRELALINASMSSAVRPLRNKGMQHLAELRCLKNLEIRAMHWITRQGLAAVGALTGLRSLKMTNCHRVTGDALVCLKSLGGLRILDLAGCRSLDDRGMVFIGALKRLKTLHLELCDNITDEGMLALASATALVRLTLGGGITDRGLIHLGLLTRLEHLGFGWSTKLTEEGIGDTILRLDGLTRLSLYGCHRVAFKELDTRRFTSPHSPHLRTININPLPNTTRLILMELFPLAVVDEDTSWIERWQFP